MQQARRHRVARQQKVPVERIAVLETQMAQVRGTQEAILDKQTEILTELSRYRGAFGMALLLFSAVGTALIFFKDFVLAKLGMRS